MIEDTRKGGGTMVKTCEAVFENGVFRPLAVPCDITEGQRVRLTVEVETPDDVLALAAKVYEGLSGEEIDEIERVALVRRDFFGGRKSDAL
jgi:predicted DNA-binding antitoxin AbrB/MazE fold protein